MSDRRLEYMRLADLGLNPANPKTHDIDGIRKSIERFGYVEPATIDERDMTIVAGHGRVKTLAAARTAGLPAPDGVIVDTDGEWLIPVNRGWSSKDDVEQQAALVALNRYTEIGGWDDSALAEVLKAVSASSFGLEGVGYNMEELSALLESLGVDRYPTTDPDDIPEPPAQPVSQLGDLWVLGDHRLLCGDSTSETDVTRLMNGDRAVLMATDPPYLVAYSGGNHPQNWHQNKAVQQWDDYVEGNEDLFLMFLTVAFGCALVDDAPVYQWFASMRGDKVFEAWRSAGLLPHQQIIWRKSRPVLTRLTFMCNFEPVMFGWKQGHKPPKDRMPPADEKDVWEVDQRGEYDKIHPTQKPVELFRRPIEWHTRPGETIYEPFGGSGTALIAAERLGRSCYTMELSPRFVDVICRRYQQHTGNKPVRAETGETVDFSDVSTSGPQWVRT